MPRILKSTQLKIECFTFVANERRRLVASALPETFGGKIANKMELKGSLLSFQNVRGKVRRQWRGKSENIRVVMGYSRVLMSFLMET
ncbi:hypothetical protein CEXT_71501 [Caerostris extrusa]|uniref:Uncharacterized protein n=1 Tax=Caerostris extrusa TaxID=172846 RepID=A0AAV4UXR7_CAEEX|nr:hypothetical protein CEXT_71501 [Caerostris extrusa]